MIPVNSLHLLATTTRAAAAAAACVMIHRPTITTRLGGRGRGRIDWRCEATQEQSGITSPAPVTTYQGIYGPWTIEPSDVREVVLYRTGLVTAAASFVLSSSTAFLPHTLLTDFLDFFFFLGAASLGLSLFLIHIYVSEIKLTFQLLWLLGVFGSLATFFSLASPAHQGLVQYVIHNPTAVWFVGPLFASLTGLVIKEGHFSLLYFTNPQQSSCSFPYFSSK